MDDSGRQNRISTASSAEETPGEAKRCVVCGYMLKGLPEAYRCPECGSEYGGAKFSVEFFRIPQPRQYMFVLFNMVIFGVLASLAAIFGHWFELSIGVILLCTVVVPYSVSKFLERFVTVTIDGITWGATRGRRQSIQWRDLEGVKVEPGTGCVQFLPRQGYTIRMPREAWPSTISVEQIDEVIMAAWERCRIVETRR